MAGAGRSRSADPPPGSPGRERICAAAVALVIEHGFEGTSVEMIVERAAVGREDFDRHFDGIEDCCIGAFDAIAVRFAQDVVGSLDGATTWRDGLRASAYAAARFIRDNQADARFGIGALMQAGETARTRREAVLALYVDMIDGGRNELDDPDSVSRSIADTVLGAIVGLVANRMQDGDLDQVESFVPDLMFIAVRPYLGVDVAREELAIPPPPERAEGRTDEAAGG